MNCEIIHGDCLTIMRGLPAASIDLVFGSPPYEQARLYLENGQDKGIARDTEAWVAWMVDVVKESLRVCKGLVAFVVEGQTRNYRYSSGPALLMADLHRAGVHLRKPPIFHRVGIPGSGGPDWLRNDWEWIICATNGGQLPWSDNTACGHPPKWAPGGEMSYRNAEGKRKNGVPRIEVKNGDLVSRRTATPEERANLGPRRARQLAGENIYKPPEKANPGNVIQCIVGGGNMGEGDVFSAENEAPFPEALVTFFVLSFCPPSGRVLDPFSGSGTTAAVSIRHGRQAIAIDIRESQCELTRKRLANETPLSLLAE